MAVSKSFIEAPAYGKRYFNTSGVFQGTVAYASLHAHMPGQDTFITILNRPIPSEMSIASDFQGPIIWHCTQTNHYYSLDEVKRHNLPGKIPLPKGFAVGHPAFGVLLHDEDGGSDTMYHIRADPNRWIGFAVRFKMGTNNSWTPYARPIR
jgi:hypothetical protein